MHDRARLLVQIALQQQMHCHTELQLALLRLRLARRRRRKQRGAVTIWRNPNERVRHGAYDHLLVLLRRHDPAAFTNFLRMGPEMFDELREIGRASCRERVCQYV